MATTLCLRIIYTVVIAFLTKSVGTLGFENNHMVNVVTYHYANANFNKDSIPSSFLVSIPVYINKQQHILKLKYEKNLIDSSVLILPIKEHRLFSDQFYRMLEADFELIPFLSSGANYYELYNRYQKKNFSDTTLVSYSKEPLGFMTSKLLYIYDIDDDGCPEILLADIQNSSKDNEVYELYRLESQNKQFVGVRHFFKGAFYGWDKTKKYMITGVSDTRTRKLTKNKIENGRLIPVKKCTAFANQGNKCF